MPLLHHRDGVLGVVLLAPPRVTFPLDVETFDLLRTLGQEVAMFLAERRAAERPGRPAQAPGHQALRLRRHDVKTVGSQLSLLLANAEENIADPEFQTDMLMTVRCTSAERINTLIARLRQPAPAPESTPQSAPRCRPGRAARRPGTDRSAAKAAGHSSRALAIPCWSSSARALPCTASDPRPSPKFDAAVTHLLDNAYRGVGGGPAEVRIQRRGDGGIVIDITSHGRA